MNARFRWVPSFSSPQHPCSAAVSLERAVMKLKPLAIIMTALSLSACAVMLPNVSGEDQCVGWACPSDREMQAPGMMRFKIRFFTAFDGSVIPAADNLFSRYRADPKDPEIERLLKDFIRPGQVEIQKAFRSNFNVRTEIVPDRSEIRLFASQSDMQSAESPSDLWKAMLPLTNQKKCAALRWSATVNGTITMRPGSKNRVEYDLEFLVSVDAAKPRSTVPYVPGFIFAPAANQDPNPSANQFVSKLGNDIVKAYVDYFKQAFGVTVPLETN